MHEATVPALVSVVVVSALSFSGAAVLALGPKRLQRILPALVALSAGALLANSFLHLLPEATHIHGDFGGTVAWCTLGGLLGFFVIESVIHWHHHGEDVHHHQRGHVSPFAWMNLLGDGMHNFVDGLLIGGMWMVSPAAGLSTTIAVALHELPQEFGDFGVLLAAGLPVKKALWLNAASAATAILGAGLILTIGSDMGIEPYLMPIAAGGFIYVACADLVPEIHRRARGKALIGTSLALALGIIMVTWLPGLVGAGHSHSHGGHSHGGHGHDHGAHGCEDPTCEEDHEPTTSDPRLEGLDGLDLETEGGAGSR